MPRKKKNEQAVQPVQLQAAEGCCQEASPLSTESYIPCNKPAAHIVGWPGRTEATYRMCEMCTDHNAKNRGAQIMGPYQGPQTEQPAQSAAEQTGSPLPTTSSVESVINDLLNKTAADLVKEHFEIETYIERETKRLKEFLKPWADRDEAIKVRLQAKLNELGGEKGRSIKTEFGTFFNTTITTPKIVDKEAYLDCVLDNYETFGNGMLQLRAPNKESIDQYMKDHNGALPPGVETSSYVNLNIRRS